MSAQGPCYRPASSIAASNPGNSLHSLAFTWRGLNRQSERLLLLHNMLRTRFPLFSPALSIRAPRVRRDSIVRRLAPSTRVACPVPSRVHNYHKYARWACVGTRLASRCPMVRGHNSRCPFVPGRQEAMTLVGAHWICARRTDGRTA